MAALVQVEANGLLDSSMAGTAYTAATTPIKCALITTTTPSTATAAGSEVSGGSYARQTITFSAASAGSKTSNATINFTSMPAVTVGGVELWDSAGTPIRRWFGTLSANKTTNSGDTFSISSGQLTGTLS
jgi:hypothetical protein